MSEVLDKLAEYAESMTDEQKAAADLLLAEDTPEQARAELRVLQERKRRERFEQTVPQRYADATLESLDSEACDADTIAAWFTSDSPTLFLVGPVGTGKTHAAYAVLRQAVSSGAWVAGATVMELLDALRPDAASPLPRLVIASDVFLFDDIAAERATEWVIEQFTRIVDSRTADARRQVVTTNASWSDLVERFGDRVMSRLAGGATVVTFKGTDRRKDLW